MPITGVFGIQKFSRQGCGMAVFAFSCSTKQQRVLCVYCASAGKPAGVIAEQQEDPQMKIFAEQALSAVSWIQRDDKVIRQVFTDMIDTQIAGDQPLQQTIMNAETKINSLIKSDMRKLFSCHPYYLFRTSRAFSVWRCAIYSCVSAAN